ncbi:MAG TPA: type I secretion system permease/ATPase [Sphingobium sp.]|jgi:ATP-binding cassette subfamily C protein LapB|uniref:type I secretion system permease/ATPase n=1 Tax=Sphingobium sp. TaxID=1912891 RepID=UPI000EEA54E7|nr:type I secretion system permease/ATPase [Sphingobium sp.]HAF40548.1 type I secretion system permease/ATPase [Sphingobium sp.]
MIQEPLLAAAKPRFAPWLIEPMLRNKAIYMKVAVAAALINIFALVSSLFTMTVYDRIVPNDSSSSLIGLSIGLVFVLVFDFVLRLLRVYFVDIAGANIDHDIGETLFGRLLSLRLDQRRGSTGTLTGLMRELETLRDFFASVTLTAIIDVPFIIVTLAVIAWLGGVLVLLPMAMIPVVIGAGLLTTPALDRLSARSLGDGLVKQSVLIEAIGSLETVKAIGAGPMLSRRWQAALVSHSESSLGQRLAAAIPMTVANSASTIAYCGIIIVGVGLLRNHEITTGALLACSILCGRALAPLAQIATLLSRLSATRVAYRQINALMETPTEGPQGDALHPARLEGAIELRNVSFRYPGAPEKALDGVSLAIRPGERVGFLGRVGSGKSTLARLVLGLYEPEEGVVLIDGVDLRQYDPAELRKLIGAGMQDNVLIAGSVRQNICLDRPGVEQEEMIRAAEISGTHRFMGQIANGYDLRLADRGDGLSGGQRQSIAIARAIAGRPPILIFDEPSSSMDAQTEADLISRLQPEVAGRTLLLITHRTSLLSMVDRIVVLDRGKIVADGPRDAVLQRLARGKAA